MLVDRTLQPAEVVMSFRVSGKNLDVGEALRERINSRIGEAMSKYFDGGYSGHATVAREDSGFRTECAVHLDSYAARRGQRPGRLCECRPGSAACGKTTAPLSPPAEGPSLLKP
jgi:hypothetical protein